MDKSEIDSKVKEVARKLREAVDRGFLSDDSKSIDVRMDVLKSIIEIKRNSDLFKDVMFTVDLEELYNFLMNEVSKFGIDYEICTPNTRGWICVSDTFLATSSDMEDEDEV